MIRRSAHCIDDMWIFVEGQSIWQLLKLLLWWTRHYNLGSLLLGMWIIGCLRLLRLSHYICTLSSWILCCPYLRFRTTLLVYQRVIDSYSFLSTH